MCVMALGLLAAVMARDANADVLACIENVLEAIRAQDVDLVIQWLVKAVTIYEENPSAVHDAASELRDLLVCIRSTTSLSQTLGRDDRNVRDLERRAEALQLPLQTRACAECVRVSASAPRNSECMTQACTTE